MRYKSSEWLMMTALIRPVMKKWYGDKFTAVILRRAKPIYRDMLSRTADICENNPMASNTYKCYVYLAIWKAAAGKIRLGDYRRIVEQSLDWFVNNPAVRAAGKVVDANTEKGIAALEAMFRKSADWLKAHPEYADVSWDFNFDSSIHRDGTYYYFTHCPIESFARENGLLDVLPICCDIDYKTAGIFRASLHREHTLASGGEICDYWFVGDKLKDPR